MSMVRSSIDFVAVNEAALADSSYFEKLLPDSHREGSRLHAATLNGGRGRSFNINTQTGAWFDQSTGDKGGDVISLVAAQRGIKQVEAAAQVADDLRISTPRPATLPRKNRDLPECPIDWSNPTAVYQYFKPQEGEGTAPKHCFDVLRWERDGYKKTIRQSLGMGADGRYIPNAKGAEQVPYNLVGKAPFPGVCESCFVVIVEGENKVDRLAKLGICGSCCPGGAGKWRPAFNEWFRGKEVVILPDNDEPGRKHARDVAQNLQGVAASVKVCELPGLPEKGDVIDWLKEPSNDKERLQALMTSAPPTEKSAGKLRPVNIAELLALDVPPRGHILHPVIPEQGLVMLFADRGTGKTFTALHMAYAVASGGKVFNWQAETPRRVLYVDGEMPLAAMQDRIAMQVDAAEMPIADPDFFKLITPDLQPDFVMPNLALPEGQQQLEPYLQGVELLVIDNLSTLCRTGGANNEDHWADVQSWILSLRRRKISVLLVHHASKNGTQRGTIAKEDVLDTVIKLSRPKDYEPEQGARFAVTLTKARGEYGGAVEPFEATLLDGCRWQVRPIEDVLLDQIRELAAADMTQREIAEEVGASRSTINRLCKAYGINTKGGRR